MLLQHRAEIVRQLVHHKQNAPVLDYRFEDTKNFFDRFKASTSLASTGQLPVRVPGVVGLVALVAGEVAHLQVDKGPVVVQIRHLLTTVRTLLKTK